MNAVDPNAAHPRRPEVHVIALGGTIAMTGPAGAAVVPRLTADDLVAAVPQLADAALVRAESFRQVPSASLTLGDLQELAVRIAEVLTSGAAGVVVTQGTDTLEETAYFLDLVHRGPEPVVVTGAMRNPSSAGADGPANLLAAVQVAASPTARDQGVLVVLDEQVHAAPRVRKVRTSSPGAFASPGAGPLGWVVEGQPHLLAQRARRVAAPRTTAAALAGVPVALIPLALGEDARLLEALPGLGYEGVVVQAMGGGHVPSWLVDPLSDLAARIPVVLASRAGAGRVLEATYGFPGSEVDLLARGLVPAGFLDGSKARILLTVLLAAGVPRDRLGEWFARG